MMVVSGRHLTLYLNMRNVDFLIRETMEHFIDDDDKKLLQHVNKNLNRFGTLSHMFFIMMVLGVGGLIFLPFISSNILLPYKIWFPFNAESNFAVFLLTKGYAIVCMALFACSMLPTLFVGYLMFNISIRYEAFGCRLRSINKTTTDRLGTSNLRNLIECVKYDLHTSK